MKQQINGDRSRSTTGPLSGGARLLRLLAFIAAAGVASTTARSQELDLAVEPLMRDIQARYAWLHQGSFLPWPEPVDGCPAVHYPADASYHDLIQSGPKRTDLMNAIKGGVAALLVEAAEGSGRSAFYTSDWVERVLEQGTGDELNIDMYGPNDFSSATTEFAETASIEACEAAVEELSLIIAGLKYADVTIGVRSNGVMLKSWNWIEHMQDWSEWMSFDYCVPEEPLWWCHCWSFEDRKRLFGDSQNDLDYTRVQDSIEYAWVREMTHADSCTVSLVAGANRGISSLEADLRNRPGHAEVWLLVTPDYSVVSSFLGQGLSLDNGNPSPVEVVGHWDTDEGVWVGSSFRSYVSLEEGEVRQFSVGGPEVPVQLSVTPAETEWDIPVAFGWRVTSQIVVAEGDFRVNPEISDCTSITVGQQTKEAPPGQRCEGDWTLGDCHGCQPKSSAPVSLATGLKVEREVDFAFEVPGQDYQFIREYCSQVDREPAGEDPGTVGGNLVGNLWTAEAFQAATVQVDGESVTVTLDGPPSHSYLVFYEGTGGMWHTTGAPTQFLTKETVVVDGVRWPVWRLTQPGAWERDFYRYKELADGAETENPDAKLRGLQLETREVSGARRTYVYDTAPSNARLFMILLHGPGSEAADAQIEFNWIYSGPGETIGKLRSVAGKRRVDTSNQYLMTNSVEFLYAAEDPGGASSWSDDIGWNGDLVQVTRRTLVDGVNGAQAGAYWTSVMQYRYHGSTPRTGTDERLTVDGAATQLKSVIQPEQIEFYAQKRGISVEGAAAELLTLDDDAVLEDMSGLHLVDLASKILSYEDGGQQRVQKQFVQTACGCGGSGAQGLKYEYAYFTYDVDGTDDGQTTRIREFRGVDGQAGVYESSAYRTQYHDLIRLGDNEIPYTRYEALKEEPDGRVWVTAFAYDDRDRVVRKFTPSAMATYTPYDEAGAGTPPSYAAKTAGSGGGLVYAYGYNEGNRPTETRVGEGNLGTELEDLELYTRVSTTVYETEAGHEHLPARIEQYRAAYTEDAPAADDTETVWFEYGFRGESPQIAWQRMIVEAERPEENGPGTGTTYGGIVVYDTYDLYDELGQNRWTRHADGSVTFRKFDPATGAVVQVTENANPAGPAGQQGDALQGVDYADLDVGGWGATESDGELTTRFRVDELGRVRESESPSGVREHTVRELRDEPDRPGLQYLAVVHLPAVDESGGSSLKFNGPASVTWLSAGGKQLRTSLHEVDPEHAYEFDFVSGFEYEYALQSEVGRTESWYGLSGLLEAQRSWHDARGLLPGTGAEDYYETTFTYDGLGRLDTVKDAAGSATRNAEYDVFDRVLAVTAGVAGTDPEDMLLIEERFYDGGGAEEQGTGNGNLTLVKRHSGEGSGVWSPEERVTKVTYDWRDRPIVTINAALPHEMLVYDNLGRVTARGLFRDVPNEGIESDTRGAYSESAYSQRGLLYKSRTAIDPNPASTAGFLETNEWFDSMGRSIETWGPSAPAAKRKYDGLGRVVESYVTDRGGDELPGASGNYADAVGLDDDRVVQQAAYRYDDVGRLDLVTTWQRLHDTTATGALGSSSGVATFAATYFDAFDRAIFGVDFGTNPGTGADQFAVGGEVPNWPPSEPPNRDATGFSNTIVVGTTYNARGLVDTTTDPEGRITKYVYDDLGRRAAVIENYEDAEVAWSGSSIAAGRWSVSELTQGEPDKDRATTFVYDGLGRVVKQAAHVPGASGEEVQVTQYVYGVTTSEHGGDSLIESKALLKEVRYPREDTGEPSDSDNSLRVRYSYNRLGELRTTTDQNGTVHELHRDAAGRTTQDAATPGAGSGIDGAIARLEFTYDEMGRAKTATSIKSAGGEANEVKFRYTPLGQVKSVYQNVSGAVTLTSSDEDSAPSGTTRVVRYTYATEDWDSGNYSRAATEEYPNGSTTLTNGYGSSGGLNDRISRIGTLSFTGISGNLAEYSWLGASTAAAVNYAGSDVQLDRTLFWAGTSGDPAGRRRTGTHADGPPGVYPGFDRFGRVASQAWADGALTAQTGGSPNPTVPNRPEIVLETYSYDRAGNRLSRFDARPGAQWADRDWKFTLDGLDRMTKAERGHTGSSWAAAVGGQEWLLDGVGNWKEFKTDKNGDGDVADAGETETRTHNRANETTARDPDAGGALPSQGVTYDAAGNRATYVRTPATTDAYTHDAWNRLVKHGFTGVAGWTDAEYEYNALHWRTRKRVDTGGSLGVDQQREYYYDAAWRVLEERIDEAYAGSPGINRVSEQVWGLAAGGLSGPSPSPDAPVFRRVDFTADGVFDKSYYHLTDAQGSSVALIGLGSIPLVQERVSYEPYGQGRHRWPGDVNNDGSVNITDQNLIAGGATIGTSGYNADADMDRNGMVGGGNGDLGRFLLWMGKGPLAAGLISDPSTTAGPDNPVGYGGYVFSPEVKFYLARHRWFDPVFGRWIERDPAGYVDGMGLYEYVRGGPWGGVDAWGLYLDRDSVRGIRDGVHGTYIHTYDRGWTGWFRNEYVSTVFVADSSGPGEAREYDPVDSFQDARRRDFEWGSKIAGHLKDGTEIGVATAEVVLTVIVPGPEDLVIMGFCSKYGIQAVTKVGGKLWGLSEDGSRVVIGMTDAAKIEKYAVARSGVVAEGEEIRLVQEGATRAKQAGEPAERLIPRPTVATGLTNRVTKELPIGQLRTAEEAAQARNFFERNRGSARKWWEERSGREWPSNATHYEHPRSIKDGGDPLFVEPGFEGPAKPHMIVGPDGLSDFQRWGQMGGRPKKD